MVTSYCALVHCTEKIALRTSMHVLHQQKGWDMGSVGGVTHRVLCTWQLPGWPVTEIWLALVKANSPTGWAKFSHWLHKKINQLRKRYSHLDGGHSWYGRLVYNSRGGHYHRCCSHSCNRGQKILTIVFVAWPLDHIANGALTVWLHTLTTLCNMHTQNVNS